MHFLWRRRRHVDYNGGKPPGVKTAKSESVKCVSPYLRFCEDQRAGIWVACSHCSGMTAWPFPALSKQPDGVWATVKNCSFPIDFNGGVAPLKDYSGGAHRLQWRSCSIERL
ncbi:hypothetical protein FKM82_024708 [Ascaphus truei]